MIKEMNFRTFKHGFFLTHFLSVTSRKNQSNSLRRGVVFSLTRPIFFALIESCCFWFVTSQGLWEFKKRKELTISWIFCPSNAHNSNVQSFPDIKNFLTGRMSLCIVRESNPCQLLGRRLCYHYTNDAAKDYDQRDDFQNFQTWIFHYTFSECHIKKNQNYSLRSGVVFSLIRPVFFSLIESCCFFWFVTSQGQWELKKRQKCTISWVFCPSNAHNSKIQTFPEITHSFTRRLILCIVRESNPCHQLGRLLCYHYTNDAEKVYDRRDQFQNF